MKATIIIFLAFLLLSTGCREATLEETGGGSANFVAVNIEPPAVSPGDEINVSVALDNGKGNLETAQIQIGNNVFTETNSADLTIPGDISKLFGDQAAENMRSNGYVDIPVKIISNDHTARKYFRIKGSGYEPSLYDENPSIDVISYSTSDTARTVIEPEKTVMFAPDSIPEKIDLTVDETTLNENIKDSFEFSWTVFGTGSETPQIIDFDERDGSASFSFRDSGGAPLVGTYRFYLVVKPSMIFPLTYEARYCSDFITFTVNTTGSADTTEEDPDSSEVDDADSE